MPTPLLHTSHEEKKHILQFYNVAKNSGKLQQLIFSLHLKLAATLPLSFQRFLYKLKGTLQTLLMVCLRRLVGILFLNTFCIAGRLNIDNSTTCRTEVASPKVSL